MSEINYDDKADLIVDTTIDNIFKVTASDMNEIKSVVNTNAEEIGDTTSLTTTDKTNVVNAINELNAPEKWVSVGATAPTDGRRVWFKKSKNLLPNNATTQIINGVTFAVNSDKSVTINGTASANADFYLYGSATDNGSYIYIPKGTYSISTPSAGWLYIGREKTLGARVGNASILEALSSQNCYFYGFFIRVNANATINNLTLFSQLEEGSTATTYEPYVTPSINVDGKKWLDKVNDTGWIDITNYINTSNFAVRTNDAIKARRIGNIVYFKGEIYCKTALSSHNGNIMNGIPSIFRPTTQYSRCGVKYDLGVPYNIFIATNGNITISEGQNISVTPDYKGYQLTNLSGFLVD